jgi:hypothetical protein
MSGRSQVKPSLRSLIERPALAAMRLAAAASLLGVAAIAASAEPARTFGNQSAIGVEIGAAPAANARQLAALNRTMRRLSCERPETVARLQACRQLQTRVRLLSGEARRTAPKASRTARPSAPKSPATLYGANVAGQYRTMCVRLCDGFYFPVNEASRPSDFAADEARCRSSCTAPSKLFYMASSEDDAGGMKGLDGRSYADLPNAFRYRGEYVMQCACKPKPWSEEAKLVYDRRAVLAARSALERQVAAGADAAGRLLAQGEIEVAGVGSRASQSKVRQADASAPRSKERRVPRYTNGFMLAPPQSGSAPPKRRFFLFRW